MLNRNNIKKIESLEITKQDQEKVNQYFKFHNRKWIFGSDYTHYLKRETNIQGLCCCCDEIPTKIITHKSGFVERFCNEHYKMKKFKEHRPHANTDYLHLM